MLRKIFILLLLINSVVFASDNLTATYTKEKTFDPVLFADKIEVAENFYLDINLFTAISMVDDTLIKEQALEKNSPEETLFTFSYKF